MKKNTNDELVFVPLGGSGEIGMNLNCYGYGPEANRQWLIVDVGVTFGDLSTPGVDVIVPDPAFLEGETIRGIVLTHAHEDHIGALGWLWSRMKAEWAKPMTVIGTGGVASLFEGATDSIDHFDADLTIRGLLEIWRRNAHLKTT